MAKVFKAKKCPNCLGRGICTDGSTCPTCKGHGEIPSAWDVKVPDIPCWSTSPS